MITIARDGTPRKKERRKTKYHKNLIEAVHVKHCPGCKHCKDRDAKEKQREKLLEEVIGSDYERLT